MYVGLISDTHGVFSEGFRSFLEPVDVIWHAGDFGGGLAFADSIAAFKPLVGVAGNCDGQDIRREYPMHQYLEVQGLKVLMTHIGGSPGHYDLRAQALIDQYKPDVFICGHSHILKVMMDKRLGCLHINPGAAGVYGQQPVRTLIRFVIDGDAIKDLEIIELKE
jgi:putative phosphoesterase